MAFVPGSWQQQSPVCLTKATSVYADDPSLRLSASKLGGRVFGQFKGEHGHANFELDDGRPRPTIRLGKGDAELQAIHMHRKSEHDVDGEHDGEIHLIHRILHPGYGGSTRIVLGVLFDGSPSGRSKVLAGWAEHTEGKTWLDLAGLLPRVHRFYRYEGSLTTGPYTEDVSWVVFRDPVVVPSATLRALGRTEQKDRRHMPLDRRFVLRNFR